MELPRQLQTEQVRGSAFVFVLVGFIAVTGLINLPAQFKIGGISLLGALTAAFAVIFLIRTASQTRFSTVLMPIYLLFGIYFLYGAYSLLTHTINLPAIQNFLSYAMFAGGVVVFAQYSYQHADGYATLLRWIKRAVWVSAGLFLFFTFAGNTLNLFKVNDTTIFGLRSFGHYATAGVAIYVTQGLFRQRFRRLHWGFFIVCIVASLSRSASAVALLMVPAARMYRLSGRSIIRLVVGGIAVVLIFYLAVAYVPAIHRFFLFGDEAFNVGGLAIDSRGRWNWWQHLWASFLASPIFGNGIGSAVYVISSNIDVENDIQPHNDHLRLLHDFGIVGYAVFCTAIGAVLIRIYRAWRAASVAGNYSAVIHGTAFLYTGGFLLVMLTDNILIYFPNVGLLAVLLGTSLGRSVHDLSRAG